MAAVYVLICGEIAGFKIFPYLATHMIDFLIDCIVFNAVSNSISVISRRPLHLSMFFLTEFF